ncbi:uncharacterized protein LOC111624696 isoform X2 [Centruroides sculpturatus]|uniref:uncharacterized protein LOC111624696 isoform X2 n=1 Tax=Centruroides sculpturatus TaxID=218467 RepID=UPI000C6CE47D|nr:uncharacterized protein LOC111624696 isoform X2 [Centruroides sculpturatus]
MSTTVSKFVKTIHDVTFLVEGIVNESHISKPRGRTLGIKVISDFKDYLNILNMATKRFKTEDEKDFSPADIILHNDPSGKKGSFTIRSNISSALAFKIKCSDPAFKIKPQTGVLGKKDRKSAKNVQFFALFTAVDNINLTEEDINELFDNSSESLDKYLKKILISESKSTIMSSLTNFTEGYILNFILFIIFIIFLQCYCI